MKIVVIGGTGLIGKKVVSSLHQLGHEAIAAAPSNGINAVTGEGLADALAGAHVVVDVTNSPSFEDKAVMAFFEASTRNLIAAEKAAGVTHHVALSVVGTERLQESGYFRAKLAQESLIKASKVPYSIVRATQFYEFMGAIAHTSADGDTVRLSTAHMQPIASDDVAAAIVNAALGAPRNGMVEVAGPERASLSDFVGRHLKAVGDTRTIVAEPQAPYFGTLLNDQSLTPGEHPHLGTIRFDDWLQKQAAKA
ncbi:SDR family oxidoreductase [Archangium lansingense]|uniref:SDR family oxidoreductase n=1 Tax=Archangium lansingense TaxID=2995310 RepID=A0ABT4AB45_9BACT|nr:SDR family oxidoreductase [Archangium lansinium]MCY1078900.1 SDR family oxidoreductase [Archangium lansinium]